MKRLAYFVSFLAVSALIAANVPCQPRTTTQCMECHSSIESDSGPAHDFTNDIHYQNGLGCNDCHGGDPTLDDMDAVRKSAGFRGAPDRFDIPAFCARCHSNATYMHEHNPSLPVDQLDKYKTSTHGTRLFAKKDQKVATCVSCHTAHRIGDPRMPHSTTYPLNVPSTCGKCHSDSAYMAEYGIPTDQESAYLKSVHGQELFEKKDMSAPVCNSCHGNHGAAPPEVSSVAAVCGTCHTVESNLYDASPHATAFQASGLPMCATCHSNHGIMRPSDSLIGFAQNQICGNCHSADEGGLAPVTVDSLQHGFASLTRAVDSASQLLRQASVRGMMTSDEEFALKDINQLLIQARSSVHAVAIDSVAPKLQDGLVKARAVQISALNLVGEYHFRRWGLGIASGIITLLALLLWLKIRAIEKP